MEAKSGDGWGLVQALWNILSEHEGHSSSHSVFCKENLSCLLYHRET